MPPRTSPPTPTSGAPTSARSSPPAEGGPDDSQQPPATQRVAAPPSRTTLPIIAVAGVLLVLAIWKPWSVAPASSGATAPAAIAQPGPRTTGGVAPGTTGRPPVSEAFDPNGAACMSLSGSRLVTLVRTPEQEVRTWQNLDASEGTDPLAPEIVPIRVPSQHVVGVGLCDEGSGTEGSAVAATILEITRVAGGGPRPDLLDMGPPVAITSVAGPELAILYGAPPAPALSRGTPSATQLATPRSTGFVVGGVGPQLPTWPVGAYAVAFRYPSDPAAQVRWVRFDIIAAPGIFG